MFVISSADTTNYNRGPTNTRDDQHHLEKWVWTPSVLWKFAYLRTLTWIISKGGEQSKIHSYNLNMFCHNKKTAVITYLIVSIFPQTLHPKSQRMSESIRRSEFIEGALYCIKVRSNIIHREYKATWSEWSPATCIRNGAEEGKVPLILRYKGFMVQTVNYACKCTDMEGFLKSSLCCISMSQCHQESVFIAWLLNNHLRIKPLIRGHQISDRLTVISVVWLTNSVLFHDTFSEQDNILVILTKTLGPLCVAVGVLLFVFWCPAAR